MDLFSTIQNVKEKIEKLSGVEVKKFEVSNLSNVSTLDNLEERLSVKLPTILKELYLSHTSLIKFSWVDKESIFNKDCSGGEVNILSPKEIEMFYDNMLYTVEEMKKDEDEMSYNEGAKVLVKDWPNWIPVVEFSNGDAFCIDKTSVDNHIVFLEHDVMDGGPNIHGLKIAMNFEDLMNKWSKIGFVDIYDWTNGVNIEGIDLNNKIFSEIIEVLNN